MSIGDDEDYGRLRVELTDAPSDDPDVATVYLTFAGASGDGIAFEQLSVRQTVDISNFTAGSTIQLGSDQLVRAGRYTSLTLALDLDRDAPGLGAGAYVERRDGSQDALGSGRIEVEIPGEFVVPPSGHTRLIVDIDLRKLVVAHTSEGYALAGPGDRAAAFRLVDAASSGGIEGAVEGADLLESETRVAYAFRAGELDIARVRAGSLARAVSSDRVTRRGTFKIAYLPAGRYELIVVDYVDRDGDGRLEFGGARASDATIGEVTRSVLVSAGAQVGVRLALGDVLP